MLEALFLFCFLVSISRSPGGEPCDVQWGKTDRATTLQHHYPTYPDRHTSMIFACLDSSRLRPAVADSPKQYFIDRGVADRKRKAFLFRSSMQLSSLVPCLFTGVNGKELCATMGFWLGFGCWAAPVEPPGLPHLRGDGMEWPHPGASLL